MSTLTLLAGVVAVSAAWALWELLKGYVLKSPLDNIPGPPGKSLWKGSFMQLFERHDWDFIEDISSNYGSVVKLHDLVGARMLWVFDPKAMHHIIVKEQDVYQVARDRITLRRIFFGPGLLGTMGEHHRRQRKLLNPVFSIANMRHLMPIFYETIHRLENGMTRQIKAGGNGTEVEMINWMGRTALELVGQGGLGYSFDPLTEPVYNPYGESIKRIVPAQGQAGIWRLAFMFSHHIPLPNHIKGFLANLVPNKGVRDVKDSVQLAWRTSTDIYNEKCRALLAGDEALKQQVGEGKDIMSILLRANMQAAAEDRLPEDEVIAQMSTLTFAGTDTTSNALARILHILSERQDVQDKLRAEITEARNGQDISYDQLVELLFLDAICRETMRLYPPVSFVAREAFQDAVLPLSEPIQGRDGTWMNEIVVPKGTRISIGIHSCNRSKAIWGEDAHEWKPERWLNPLPDSITNARVPGVYANLMTFLGGGRSCIGFKFSQLEMKVVLSVLIESFKFFPTNKTIFWNRGGIVYPTVGPTDEKPSLPLKVELVKA